MCHCSGANNGLACATRKNYYARTTMPETFSCMLLILTNLPAIFFKCDVMSLAINITCKVFCRPTEAKE
jgi:hypothetical protein